MEIVVKDVVKGEEGAFTRLESWEFDDPAAVAERRELQANAREVRKRKKLEKELRVMNERQRLLDSIFKKARR